MMKYRILGLFALLALLLCLCSCTRPIKTDAPMCRFSFSHTGMHTGLIYTLAASETDAGWQAELSLLAGEREHVLEMTQEEAQALANIVQKHALNRWNGFDKVDRRALDGTGFELVIDYEDGQHLYASGSNAFPKGYREAHEEIRSFFAELMERNGLEVPF